jgi:hypothetical protein
LVILQRVGSRKVQTNQPIGSTASAGIVGQAIKIRPGSETPKALEYALGSERGKPEALDWLPTASLLVDVTKDQLSLPTGIRCGNQTIDFRSFHELFDLRKLGGCLLDYDQGPALREQRKIHLPPYPPRGLDVMGFGECYEMTDRPCNVVRVTLKVRTSLGAASESLG